jgi:anti-sigma-K factor RskA
MSDDDRLSGYLLGELEQRERAAFEAELEADPALRAEIERLTPVVSRLEALEPSAWEQPPPLPALAVPPAEKTAEPRAAAPPRTPWWRRSLALRPVPAAALAAVLLALGVAGGLLLGNGAAGGPGDVSAGDVVVLAPVEPQDAGAQGTATLASTGERATVRLRGLTPSEPGQFYELWLLNTVDDMIALGSFSVPSSGAIDVTVPLPGDAGRFSALDLSVEPDDGDPAHSTVSVLRAPLQES